MEGINKFREAFRDFTDNYVIIGGTACDFTMADTAVRARATHDIDMIVIVENLTPEFGERFWQFVREAGYRPEKRRSKDENEPVRYELYRFLDGRPEYPEMIELLSKHPDKLGEPKDLRIEPIPFDDELSSLSAIILEDDLYQFTITHSRITDGVRHADEAALIALKVKAYLNLIQEKKEGRHVNTKDIKKHRSDVLKNLVILEAGDVSAPESIVGYSKEFVDSIRSEWDTLAGPLASSLDQSVEFIDQLLEQLYNLFTAEQE